MSNDTSEMESVRVRRRPVVSRGNSLDGGQESGRGFAVYSAVCFSVGVVLLGAWFYEPAVPSGRVAYVTALFALATAPAFFARGAETRLLAFFMLWYGTIFGIGDAVAVFFGPSDSTLQFLGSLQNQGNFLSGADIVVFVGGAMFVFGYLGAVWLIPCRSGIFAREWAYPVIFWGAIAVYIPTTVVTSAYYLSVDPGRVATHVLSIPLNIVSNLRILPMISSVMLIYLGLRGYRPRRVWLVLMVMIGFEFALGFVANTKEVSFRIPALLVIGSYFVRGRLELKWIAIIIVLFIPYQFLFDIYREQFLQERSKTTIEAVQSAGEVKNFVSAKAAKKQTKEGVGVIEESLRSLSDRVYARKYIDIIVERTGKDVAYQNGATLLYVIYSFIPRAIWPDKPQISTGQLFNREFGLSQSRLTFVPSTFLGELYWNFGYGAVVIGMAVIGGMFGIIGSMARSLPEMTSPRFILLLLATYFLVLRFEAGLGQQFGKMGRIVVVLLLMNMVLSRVMVARPR